MNLSTSYGFWPLVVINSAIFILFAFSFTKPKTSHDRCSLGTFPAFIVAMFVEMYGFPILVDVYGRLAKREEEMIIEEFGDVYEYYRKRVPAFIPNWGNSGLHTPGGLT